MDNIKIKTLCEGQQFNVSTNDLEFISASGKSDIFQNPVTLIAEVPTLAKLHEAIALFDQDMEDNNESIDLGIGHEEHVVGNYSDEEGLSSQDAPLLLYNEEGDLIGLTEFSHGFISTDPGVIDIVLTINSIFIIKAQRNKGYSLCAAEILSQVIVGNLACSIEEVEQSQKGIKLNLFAQSINNQGEAFAKLTGQVIDDKLFDIVEDWSDGEISEHFGDLINDMPEDLMPIQNLTYESPLIYLD